MRALVVLALMVLAAAASALAYTTGGLADEVGWVAAATWREPVTLIISGSLLIGAASAVRRLTI